MNYLIRNIKIIDAASPHHGKVKDILIIEGNIKRIEKEIRTTKKVEEIDGKGLLTSVGWMDVFAHFCDPGLEYKEDLETGMAAAMNGGFTTVAVSPQTEPVIDNKSQVEYILSNTAKSLVEALPIGALTVGLREGGLTEMLDMNQAGAIAFSQGNKAVQHTGLMLKGLEYSKAFDGIVLSLPEDKTISQDGSVNESEVSTQLGLKGKPAIAEELAVARDLYLSEYSDGRLHFIQISTKESAQLIKAAKKKRIKVSASVSPYHLIFDDSVLMDFDTNYKMNPPLRSSKDRKALVRALKDGTIDTVTAFHHPQNEDDKKVEFEHAEDGVSGIETVFSMLNTYLADELSVEEMVEILAVRSRKVYDLEVPKLAENEPANLTIFSNKEKWMLTEKTMKSKSKNHPLLGKELCGRVKAVLNRGQLKINY